MSTWGQPGQQSPQNPWGASSSPWQAHGAPAPARTMMPAAPPAQAATPWGYPQPAPAGYAPAGYAPPAAPGYPPAANVQGPGGYAYPSATNYAPGYYPQAQPAKASNTRLVLLLVLIPLALFVVIILVKIMSSIGTTPEIVVTTTNTPPISTTSTSPTETTPPDQQYANDDYQIPDPDLYPPELPFPDTYGMALDWMQNNAFYDRTAPIPVRCEVDGVDPATASKAEMSAFLNELMGCLMRVWAPELQGAGFNAARPSVTTYSGDGQTACGKFMPQNAFYCAADQQVYYSMDLPTMLPQHMHDPFLPLVIIAHEFGHAIQAQTGILLSERVWQQEFKDEGDDATAMQLSRRLEVQADCFAGEFAAAVQQSTGLSDDEYQFMLSVFIAIGDDTLTGDPNYVGDHGHGGNRQAWFILGFQNRSLGSCNTFADSVPDGAIE